MLCVFPVCLAGTGDLWRQVLCDVEPAATLQRLVWEISRRDSFLGSQVIPR